MWTNVAKPTNGTYTSIGKPTNGSYTNILKPTQTFNVRVGMATGLICPPTRSVNSSPINYNWTKIPKPT